MLIQEIMAGNLDAAIIEDTVAQGYLEKNKEVEGFTVEDAEGGYAIAFPKESELTEEFNNALKEMIDNGEIDTIVKKYFKSIIIEIKNVQKELSLNVFVRLHSESVTFLNSIYSSISKVFHERMGIQNES